MLPDNADLLVSQDTWNSYQSMLRVLKRYSFGLHRTANNGDDLVPGHVMAFSSYPGLVYSGDDFTVLSSGLVTLETTIGNSNADLWRFVTAENAVLEGVRATVANRLAHNGRQWTKIFAR